MILKWIFDKLLSFIGLLFLWPVLLVVAILVKVKMPGGPASLCRSVWVRMASYSSAISSVQ